RVVRALDLRTLSFVELTAQECGFAYRRSIFNTSHQGRYLVTQVKYELINQAVPVISYADLKHYFREKSAVPTLAAVSSAVREIRRGKGMLIVPGDPDCRSAGSFFKNPVISSEHFAQIVAHGGSTSVPHYPAANEQVKLPAAWLLDQAGF